MDVSFFRNHHTTTAAAAKPMTASPIRRTQRSEPCKPIHEPVNHASTRNTSKATATMRYLVILLYLRSADEVVSNPEAAELNPNLKPANKTIISNKQPAANKTSRRVQTSVRTAGASAGGAHAGERYLASPRTRCSLSRTASIIALKSPAPAIP